MSCHQLPPRAGAARPQPASPARPQPADPHDPVEAARALDERTAWPTHRIRGFLLSQRAAQLSR